MLGICQLLLQALVAAQTKSLPYGIGLGMRSLHVICGYFSGCTLHFGCTSLTCQIFHMPVYCCSFFSLLSYKVSTKWKRLFSFVAVLITVVSSSVIYPETFQAS